LLSELALHLLLAELLALHRLLSELALLHALLSELAALLAEDLLLRVLLCVLRLGHLQLLRMDLNLRLADPRLVLVLGLVVGGTVTAAATAWRAGEAFAADRREQAGARCGENQGFR
jgi:hypothetical protein